MLREEEETGGGGGGKGIQGAGGGGGGGNYMGGGRKGIQGAEGRGGGRNYITHKYGGPHVGRALRVKTIDFKRLYMNNTVQQNKNFYEEQLLQ